MRPAIALAALTLVGCPGAVDEPPANQPPTAPEIAIFPADPVATDWLDAVILGQSVDPEGGDVVHRYRWTLGGVPADFLDDLTAVWPEETSSGDAWEVTVTGVDAEGLEGPPGRASVVVRGSPPSIRGALLGPPGATFEDPLVVEGLEWEDPDGDSPAYRYAWWKNGRLLDADEPSLPAEETSEGDSVFVALTPVDDEFEGATIDSNTLVVRGLDPCVALILDGVDDHVTVGGDPLPTLAGLAVEAWVRPDGPGVVASTRAGDEGWELRIGPSGEVLLRVGPDEVASTVVVPVDGALHHVVGTRNDVDGEVVLFVDGAPAGEGVTDVPGAGGPLVLGRRSDAQEGFFPGVLDDVRVSDVPRYRDAFAPGLYWAPDAFTVAAWHWSEGVGSASVDQVGARDAALVGAGWSTTLSACAR